MIVVFQPEDADDLFDELFSQVPGPMTQRLLDMCMTYLGKDKATC